MSLALEFAMTSAWCMEEPALRQLFEIAAREHEVKPEALQAYRAKSLEKGEKAKVRDGVAVISLDGPLFKKANLFVEMSGATSYETVRRDFQTALDDGNVKAILFAIDSPGGEAAGCAELAAAISAARGKKPIVAYAGDIMASAAYWIGSAADKIVIGKSAAVGSIGVRASLSDTSARDARSGVQRFDFVSSQSPYKVSDPKSDDGAARLQARVDAIASVFVETVAANRGVTVAHVLDAFGKGDVKIGNAAVQAGMADDLGTFESTLADLLSQSDPLASIGFKPAAMRGAAHGENATMPTTEEVNAAKMAARQEAAASFLRSQGVTIATPTARPPDGDAAFDAITGAFRATKPGADAAAGEDAVDAIMSAFHKFN